MLGLHNTRSTEMLNHKNVPKHHRYLIIIFAMLLLPNIFWAMKHLLEKDFLGKSLILLFGFLMLFLPLVLMPISKKIYFSLLAVPFVLLLSPVVFNIWKYDLMPSKWVFIAVLDSNPSETKALFAGSWWLVVPLLFAFGLYGWVVIKKIDSKPLKTHLLTKVVGVVVLALFVVKDVFFAPKGELTQRFNLTFPLGSASQLAGAWAENNTLKQRSHTLQNFRFGSNQNPQFALQKQTVLLVIGETARHDHFGIYQYARNTTPLLASLGNDLLVFADVASEASITIKSVPLLLTRADANNFDAIYKEKSLISAFKEAGFKTYWLSNQTQFGKHNTNTSFFAQEADVFAIANKTTQQKGNRHDEVLLKQMDNILNKNEPKVLIILHTLGSHLAYNLRYPKAFQRFNPSGNLATPLQNTLINKQNLINAYDNSILYTDFIIYQAIKRIDKPHTQASMLYVSDHGENLFDDQKNLFGHGITNRYDSQIPLVVWLSDEHKTDKTSQYQALKNNRNKKISADNVFYTLLDLAHISFPNLDSTKSIASPHYLEPKQRKVLTIDDKVLIFEEMK